MPETIPTNLAIPPTFSFSLLCMISICALGWTVLYAQLLETIFNEMMMRVWTCMKPCPHKHVNIITAGALSQNQNRYIHILCVCLCVYVCVNIYIYIYMHIHTLNSTTAYFFLCYLVFLPFHLIKMRKICIDLSSQSLDISNLQMLRSEHLL